MNTGTTSVAIQGVQGAFHEIAARQLFKTQELEIIACTTFEDLFNTVENNQADYGIVAVENTIAGNLADNYHLLCQCQVTIVSEICIAIKQNLLCMPGQLLSQIREIHSHPVALKQCTDFLKPLQQKGVKIVETTDTALSAKLIRDNQLTHVAAIGSTLAAKLYGMDLLAEGIENNSHNKTRFVLIKRLQGHTRELLFGSHPHKATLCFTLPHSKGQLSEVVAIFSRHSLNLTNFILTPIPDKNWEYRFCVDLTFIQKKDFDQSIAAIENQINDLKIIGVYEQC